ncbi:pantoate--beta-alanine ligase [Falsirhodobacter halotolerans]|uniref:pantoate--beta-alanine ligase n=1 Tax=Falsirhodobacter halotolerans TaxID=1146892 RepID=UPI001FD34D32|nr:pantoate--beta-alanine ligase [Falsirhodobacter halotolerans]MCJ8140540.1 pantoate--beta-alanine ligase [Falsirhodobacter halotolerans]
MILRRVVDLRRTVAAWRREGATVGVVPTMGALHEGHLSLVAAARAQCDRVIVTIFVNPAQFNNPEDLAKYPRDEARDIALLDGVAVFLPEVDEVYPPGFSSTVHVKGLSDRLEGAHRPGHFDGMATVVTKLFGMTQADVAFFGEKDWQQLQIVRRMVADLNLPIRIVGCPTSREADGLAMSSRNRRLNASARDAAQTIHRAMTQAATAVRAGDMAAVDRIPETLKAAGFRSVDYAELADAETLAPVQDLSRPARILVAATVDGVRLIDNIAV